MSLLKALHDDEPTADSDLELDLDLDLTEFEAFSDGLDEAQPQADAVDLEVEVPKPSPLALTPKSDAVPPTLTRSAADGAQPARPAAAAPQPGAETGRAREHAVVTPLVPPRPAAADATEAQLLPATFFHRPAGVVLLITVAGVLLAALGVGAWLYVGESLRGALDRRGELLPSTIEDRSRPAVAVNGMADADAPDAADPVFTQPAAVTAVTAAAVAVPGSARPAVQTGRIAGTRTPEASVPAAAPAFAPETAPAFAPETAPMIAPAPALAVASPRPAPVAPVVPRGAQTQTQPVSAPQLAAADAAPIQVLAGIRPSSGTVTQADQPPPPARSVSAAALSAPNAPDAAPATRAPSRPIQVPGSGTAGRTAAAPGVSTRAVPSPADDYLRTGFTRYSAGDLSGARSAYEQALLADPLRRDAVLGLAVIHQSEGNVPAARAFYERLLELYPQDSAAVAGLASLSASVGYQGTESELRTLLARMPRAPHLHAALGNLHATRGEWPQAQHAWFQALALQPQNADYSFNLAVSLERLGQPRAAIPYYQRALDMRVDTSRFDPDVASIRLGQLAGGWR